MDNKLSLLIVIANSGYSDEIMNIAKEEGSRGGTIIDGIGSVSANAEKLYGITVHPEKEVIMLIIDKSIKDNILTAIYQKAGRESPINAVAFTLPIEAATSNLKAQYKKAVLEEKKI